MPRRRLYLLLGAAGSALLMTAAGALFCNLSLHLRTHCSGLARSILLRTALLCGILAGVLVLLFLAIYLYQRDKAAELAADRERYLLFSRLAGAWLLEFDYAARRIRLMGDPRSGGAVPEELGRPQSPGQMQALCHPEDRAKLSDLLRHPPAPGREALLECRFRLPGGRYGWHECRAMAIFDGRGRPVRLMARLENIDRRKAREEALMARSTLDDLTGLLNKSAVALRVDEFLSSQAAPSGGALLMLDLDDFKSINDTRGHASGDQALLLTAGVLRELFRETDVLGRAGGDEFLVFLPGVSDPGNCWRKAEALCDTLERRARASDCCPALTCSVGVAIAPDDGDRFSDLFDAADTAMYAAKRQGKNACRLSRRGETRPPSC